MVEPQGGVVGHGDQRAVGEKAKQQRMGGVDTERALANYTAEGRSSEYVRHVRYMHRGFYHPSVMDMERMQPQLDAWLQRPELRVVIAMRESGGPPRNIPREVMRHLIQTVGIPPEHIIVAYHFSPYMNDPQLTREEAREWGAHVVDTLAVVRSLDPAVQELAMKDKLTVGKGLPMLVGALTAWALNQQVTNGSPGVKYIMYHDSELGFMDEYQGSRYLAYPMVLLPDGRINHVLQTHMGRNNESVKAMHTALESLVHFHSDQRVRDFVCAIHPALMRMVHPCAGEFIIGTDTLFQLPFTDGYSIETILRFGIVGYNIDSEEQEVQVRNPNERLDGCNGGWGEQFMMNMISRSGIAYAMTGKPPHLWTLDDIHRLNQGFSQMCVIPGLPQEHGPMIGRDVSADRVLPSVNQLLEQGWVNVDRLNELVLSR